MVHHVPQKYKYILIVYTLRHKLATDFNSLFLRRSSPCFCAFDLLWIDGTDLRSLPLLARKERLHSLLQGTDPRIRYVESFPGSQGSSLFQLCCEHDLEGWWRKTEPARILEADHREAWLTIKKGNYSGAVARHELCRQGAVPVLRRFGGRRLIGYASLVHPFGAFTFGCLGGRPWRTPHL